MLDGGGFLVYILFNDLTKKQQQVVITHTKNTIPEKGVTRKSKSLSNLIG